MFYFRLIYTAIRSLDANFLRSLLATLGVLIGVSSVVACMSILEGFSSDIAKRFKSLGSNVIYVFPSEARIHGRIVGSAQTLVPEDGDRLMRELEGEIESVAPEAFGSELVKRFQKSNNYTIVATSDTYFAVNTFEASSGRLFTRSESQDESTAIALLGSKVAEELFVGGDPVGQTIRVRDVPFRVVGVLEKKGNLGFLNVDEVVYIPIKFGLERFMNRKWLNRLTISASDPQKVDETQKKVKQILRTAHNIRAGQPEDFNIFKQEEAMQSVNQMMFIWKVVFYSIAGISLVVGGIGIMNIMLVSVTERTREIGVRIAVGARRGDILLQFLVEAMVISLLGGGFGLLLGSMFADLLEKVIEGGFFKTEVSTYIIAVSLTTATAVGVFSGLYPAFKASRLDPVEALRYE